MFKYIPYFFLSFVLTACTDVMEPRPDYREAVIKAFAETDRAFSVREEFNFLAMLENRQFAELNTAINSAQSKYEKAGQILVTLSIFDDFYTSSSKFASYFDAWVEHDNKAWPAYMARGIYYSSVAWEKRGEKYIKDTPKENIKQFRLFMHKSIVDVNQALQKRPNLLIAYWQLIGDYGALGERKHMHNAARYALTVAPGNYDIYKRYFNYLEPRWGGSYKKMREVAIEAQQYREQDPRVYALLGFEFADKGAIAGWDKQYNKAISLYTQAINYTPRTPWLYDRAYYSTEIGDFKTALRDMDEALSYEPKTIKFLSLRGKTYMRDNQTDKAIADYKQVLQIQPDDVFTRTQLGWLYQKLGQVRLGAEQFDIQLKYHPDNMTALIWCGQLYARLRETGRATECMNKATEVEPDNPLPWRIYGDVLHMFGDPKHKELLAKYLELADPAVEGAMYKKVRDYLIQEGYPVPKSVRPYRGRSG